jgi:hypothetical protein
MWKHEPTKPARETRRMMKPMTVTGVWREVVQREEEECVIHRPAPISGMDARRVRRFRYPNVVLLKRYMVFWHLTHEKTKLCSLSFYSQYGYLFLLFFFFLNDKDYEVENMFWGTSGSDSDQIDNGIDSGLINIFLFSSKKIIGQVKFNKIINE